MARKYALIPLNVRANAWLRPVHLKEKTRKEHALSTSSISAVPDVLKMEKSEWKYVRISAQPGAPADVRPLSSLPQLSFVLTFNDAGIVVSLGNKSGHGEIK
jgi:hypothetical protein